MHRGHREEMRLHPPSPGPDTTRQLDPGGRTRHLTSRRVWLPGVAGFGCLVAVAILGVVVHKGPTPVDEAAWRGMHGLLAQQRLTWRVVGAIAHERGPAHGVSLAAGSVGNLRQYWSLSALWPPAWRWLGLSFILLCAVPLVEALRLAFFRP